MIEEIKMRWPISKKKVEGNEYKSKFLLKPADFNPSLRAVKVDGIFNPAAIRLSNKDIMLYVRVAEKPIRRSERSLECPGKKQLKHLLFPLLPG